MRRSFGVVAVVSLLGIPFIALGDTDRTKTDAPIAATVESTLKTASDHIRQYAFDGDADTYFASEENPTATESFTLVLDKPVALKSIAVVTGRPSGEDKLEAGTLEVSKDGKEFESLAKLADGAAKADGNGQEVVAIRIRPTEDMKHPLVIREYTIESTPQVAVFKYPVEFVVNVSDAPEMKEWAEKAAKICERQYPMINEELRSDGFKPAHVVTMTIKKNSRAIAATGGTHITGQVKYFTQHPDDFGAMVHETVHVVQGYHGRGNPGWLIEGIPDYIRFFKYEPGKIGRLRDPEKMHYNQAYRVSARFLNYVSEKYDKDLVRKLNTAMRQGKYSDDLFKDFTGKTLTELDDEWRATLKG